MKQLLFILYLALSSSTHAQITLGVQKIDNIEVPQAVKDAQEKYFPGVVVMVWDSHSFA